jgi:hypothetical protein
VMEEKKCQGEKAKLRGKLQTNEKGSTNFHFPYHFYIFRNERKVMQKEQLVQVDYWNRPMNHPEWNWSGLA